MALPAKRPSLYKSTRAPCSAMPAISVSGAITFMGTPGTVGYERVGRFGKAELESDAEASLEKNALIT